MEKSYKSNKTMYYFEGFADLVTANAIFILCSIAIVTVGVGSVSLSDFMKIYRENPSMSGKQMFKFIKMYWKFGMKVGLLQLTFLVFFGINIVGLVENNFNAGIYLVLTITMLFFAFVFLLIFSLVYILPINRERRLLEISADILKIGFTNMKKTLLLMGWNILNIVGFLLVLLFSRYLSLYYFSIGFAVQNLISQKIIKDIKM